MRPRGPENAYIGKMDFERQEPKKDYGPEAEQMTLDFFKWGFRDWVIRPATPEEDAGHYGQGVGSKMIDEVVLEKQKDRLVPLAGLQTTSGRSNDVIEKKLKEMRLMPFIRLREMKREDTSIPRAVLPYDPEDIEAYLQNPDFSKHPKLVEKIFRALENSWKFDLMKTKNPREQEHVMRLLSVLEAQKKQHAQEQTAH